MPHHPKRKGHGYVETSGHTGDLQHTDSPAHVLPANHDGRSWDSYEAFRSEMNHELEHKKGKSMEHHDHLHELDHSHFDNPCPMGG